MQSVTSDQNAVSLTWGSTSTTSQSLSFSFVGAAFATQRRVSVSGENFSSSVCRGSVSLLFMLPQGSHEPGSLDKGSIGRGWRSVYWDGPGRAMTNQWAI